jgi:hypothetical protein
MHHLLAAHRRGSLAMVCWVSLIRGMVQTSAARLAAITATTNARNEHLWLCFQLSRDK